MEDMAAGQDAELEVKTSGWWRVGIRGYHSSITLGGWFQRLFPMDPSTS